MADVSPAPAPGDDDVVTEIRRELHELAVLSSALLRLAAKVQARCEEVRLRVGGLAPPGEAELKRVMLEIIDPPMVAAVSPDPAPARATGSQRSGDETDPAALLAMSLAGEGLSREQISDYLRDSFGMADADVLLDRVLPRPA